MELSNLDFAQLITLKDDIDAEIKRRESEEKSRAKKQIIELARQHGLNASDLLSKTITARKPVEAKYRHPTQPSLTWTGRGRKPLWVQEWIAKGNHLDSLMI